MKTFLLPEDLRNDLLAYLMQRPYAEVDKGVARLQALSEAPPPPPADQRTTDEKKG